MSYVALSSIVSLSLILLVFNKLQSPTPKMIIPLREGFLLENKEKLALSPREHSD